jgi:hypothetical protein
METSSPYSRGEAPDDVAVVLRRGLVDEEKAPIHRPTDVGRWVGRSVD